MKSEVIEVLINKRRKKWIFAVSNVRRRNELMSATVWQTRTISQLKARNFISSFGGGEINQSQQKVTNKHQKKLRGNEQKIPLSIFQFTWNENFVVNDARNVNHMVDWAAFSLVSSWTAFHLFLTLSAETTNRHE